MKKIIKVLLICTIILFALSVTASAAREGYYTYTVSNGEATITDVNTSISGDVVIPSTLGGYPVTTIGGAAFSNRDNLTSVEIPDSVITIGYRAFYNCKSLTSIEIPDSVTTIGDWTFYCCTKLTSVVIGNSVTTIGDYAFYGCTGLTSIEIPDTVVSIGDYTFFSCTGLKNVEIPDSVTSIGSSAFSGCTGLKNVEIPDSVTSIGSSAFSGCTGLTSIEIPDTVVSIGSSAFSNCTGLKSVEIPDSVTSIGESAFYKCTGLSSVEIGDSITTIEKYVFSGCNWLSSIVIPDSVTAIKTEAFCNCSGLRYVYYRGSSRQWDKIYHDGDKYVLENANIIYNAVRIKAYDENKKVMLDKWVGSSNTTYKNLFSEKTGYTIKVYEDSVKTKEIDINTYIEEDTEVYVEYVINQYTYKFTDWDDTVIKEVTADYGMLIEKPDSPTREGDAKCSSYTFSKWSGYSEGMKLTRDITFTAVYDTTYNHHIELVGTSVTVGNSFTEKVSMVTLKAVNYLVCEVIYPDTLELNSITPTDFKYASQETLKNKDGFNYLTVMCQYEDDETTVPENTAINPFNLSFTVSKTAKPQEIEIKFGEDTYLSGEEDYAFENKIDAKIEILPKLASSVTIYGNSTIYEPTQFTAEVYPDYTTDKTIEWKVDDETVAKISKDGVLTPIKNGSITITATAVGDAYKTKTVTVYRNAYVDGFKSDVGMWNEAILPDTKEYTIYVTEDTEAISITPFFTTGTLKYNGTVVMKNRAKEFELSEIETTITFERSNSGYNDCTYTIKVIKKAGIKNKTITAESFKENCVNLLVYKDKVTQIEEAEDITITVPEKVNNYKVLYWESLETLKPLYAPIEKEL